MASLGTLGGVQNPYSFGGNSTSGLGSAPSGGSNFFSGGRLAGIGGLLGGPVGAGVGAGFSLIGSGIMGWLNQKKEEEAEAEAKRRYEEQMAESRRQFEARMRLQKANLQLNTKQFLENLRKSQFEEDAFYEQRNNERLNQVKSSLQNILNTDGFRNKYLETWGG